MAFDLKRRTLHETARYEFTRISPDPAKPIALITRHLGFRNPAFMNAEVKRRREAGVVDLEYTRNREHEIEGLAAHCIAGWENVTDGGNVVELTPEKALDLLREIDASFPEEIEAYRYWAKNLDNFGEPVESAEALGKE